MSGDLTIAFTPDTPPYVLDEGSRGIEIELVRAALLPAGLDFQVRQMPYGELADAVNRRAVDAAATVIQADDGTYYSDEYIDFHNAAIVKRGSGIEIPTVAALAGCSIVAWENAWQDLGPEFASLFSPGSQEAGRRGYREIGDQREQVEMFWQGAADVIVIDVAVMEWFSRDLYGTTEDREPLQLFRIFPGETRFRISFRSETLRDTFNSGLQQIRATGLYQQIHDRYLRG